MNEEQIKLVSHSLGICIETAIKSDQSKHKTLPLEFYRSYYCFGNIDHKEMDESIWTDLVEKDFAFRYIRFRNIMFGITEKGQQEFRKIFKGRVTDKFVKPSKSKQEYLDYHYSECDFDNGFAGWLGIILPEYEYSSGNSVRMISKKYSSVKGAWHHDKKQAKASYKLVLKIHLQELRKIK